MGGRRGPRLALAAAEITQLADGRVHRDVVVAPTQRHQITVRRALVGLKRCALRFRWLAPGM